MLSRLLIPALVAWFACLGCAAQATGNAQAFAGTWAVRLGTRVLLTLNLQVNGSRIEGVLERPAHLSAEGNTIFSNLLGGTRRDALQDVSTSPRKLLFRVTDLTDSTAVTRYALTIVGDAATLSEANGPPATPLTLERTPAPVAISTDWQPNRTYSAADTGTDSPEMKAMYNEDQRVRTVQPIDWAAVNKSDEQRRGETRKLLDQGSLHTGTDYEEAAFIFQHSLTADDYLLAHTLAMVAITKGDSTAIWIATATLDRYLQTIGQKQIYGTQFRKIKDAWTQEPLNKELISDPLRAQLGTQPQSVDEQRLRWIPTQPQP